MANLIENPSFELDTSSPPGKWANFNSPANVTRTTDSTVSYTGGKSLKIATTDGATADCGVEQNEFSGRTGKITVLPSTTYYYSSFIKSALTTGQVHTHIKLFTALYAAETGKDTPNVTGTNDWTQNALSFTTGAADVIAEIWICFGAYGSAANGTAYFDDIYLDTVPYSPNNSGFFNFM